MFLDGNKALEYTKSYTPGGDGIPGMLRGGTPSKDISSTNPSTSGVTATPPHPKYQNNNINKGVTMRAILSNPAG
jgi:hypothetical protein